MNDPVFLRRGGGLTIAEIATIVGAAGGSGLSADRRIVNIASLDRASPADLAFFEDNRFEPAATASYAGACLTTPALAVALPARVAPLIVDRPYEAFVQVARALFPDSLQPSSFYEAVVSDGAHVHPSARLEANVTIEPGVVVGPGAEIGAGTVVGANASLGGQVRVGRDCVVGVGVSISNALIGDRVILHSGCRIGQSGFGFIPAGDRYLKMPQTARVIIQDNVEIGAGTTIDRGAIRDTVIGEGTKIDNLVQVAHNVMVGRHCIMAAQTSIDPDATIEDFVVLGARVSLGRGVSVGEGAQLTAAGTVNEDVSAGARWATSAGRELRQP